jgi:CRISPR-associated protein Cas2
MISQNLEFEVHMIIISYDISDNKLRNHFSKYIKRFGHRIQYSVFEIDVSERMLNVIEADIKNNFEKRFSQSDSIIIFRMSQTCKITRYGYAANDNSDIIIVD